jgi:hypothetical protein
MKGNVIHKPYGIQYPFITFDIMGNNMIPSSTVCMAGLCHGENTKSYGIGSPQQRIGMYFDLIITQNYVKFILT